MQKPKETPNTSGNIDPIEPRTRLEMEVFNDLGMVEEDVKETYLVVFLPC